MTLINFKEKLSQINEYWTPYIVGEVNGQQLRLAKLKGDFVWHHHIDEDELFMVLKGQLTIHLPDRTVTLDEGECFIVPKGVMHRPQADDEAHILLIEPASTKHTGEVDTPLTKTTLSTL